ncbi:hypothetical protein ACIQUF_06795 [Pseudomonas sp. NPDC090233]|uniref:hypothetical protein n=1 Tax=Pseudomonas sp. NPDC090233 TaxID=3364479 RepID=UPI00383A9ECB
MQNNPLRTLLCFTLVFTLQGLEALASTEVLQAGERQEQGQDNPIEPAKAVIFDAVTHEQVEALKKIPDLVQRLNERYKSVVEDCGEGISALGCSGLRLRRVKSGSTFPFWSYRPAAKAIESVTFSYLRADSLNNSADISSGYILMDDATAISKGKSMPPARCIYPFMAGTQNQGRSLHGCGFPQSKAQARDDESTCMTPEMNITDKEAWVNHFKAAKQDRLKQCSFSTKVPEQLIAALQARKMVPAVAASFGNELLLKAWDEDNPSALPIETLFFNAANAGSFDTALEMRKAYYAKTNVLLPIVRLDFSAPENNIVTALSQDESRQLHRDEEGRQVSDALNLRYANVSKQSCDGKAALYCSGVILRTTTYGSNYHVWDPSDRSVQSKTVSFSYVRQDTGIKELAWDTLYQGLIFKQLDSVSAPGMYPLKPLCIYPTDAATWLRKSQGCGAHQDFASQSGPCQVQNITTLAEFKHHFRLVADNNAQFTNRNKHQCSLAMTPEAFEQSLLARSLDTLNPAQRAHHNELMIEAWPQNIPKQLPLEAFFWQNPGNNTSGRDQAKLMQRDLLNTAGMWIPVIRLNLKAANAAEVFTYAPEDQAN